MLKSKLKKLVTFKKRRGQEGMGNCAGSGESAGDRRDSPKAKPTAAAAAVEDHNQYTHGELVLKVLVEINRLCSEDGALKWQPVLESLVPLSVHYMQGEQNGTFKLEAAGVDGRSFHTEIKAPGTNIHKSSAKFVQWSDKENGGTWGLNFMSEADADSFVTSCSVTPSARDTPTLPPAQQPPIPKNFSYEAAVHVAREPTSELSPSPESMTPIAITQETPTHRPDPQPLIPKNFSYKAAVARELTSEFGTKDSNVPVSNDMSVTSDKPTSSSEDMPHVKTSVSEDKQASGVTLSIPDIGITADQDDKAVEFQTQTSFEAFYDVGVESVKSEGEMSSESEPLELYQPSSPFKIKEEFLLPDIMEETEEAETDSMMNNTLDTSFQQSSLHSSLMEGELDIKETSFNESTRLEPSPFGRPQSVGEPENLDPPMLPVSPPPEIGLRMHSPASPPPPLNLEPLMLSTSPPLPPNFNPPMLPVSPPPGPLLSPELEAISDSYQRPAYKGGYEAVTNKSYRHSVAGTLEDMPPPLPLTGPPGKMISPRHSRFIDLADLSTAELKPNAKGELDVSQLVLKMSKVAPRAEETKEPPTQISNANEDRVSGTLSAKSNEVLPPLPEDHPDGDSVDQSDSSPVRERLGSYHLRTLEPPKEFSDSGFQDTDITTSSPSVALVVTKPLASGEGEKFDTSLIAVGQKVDSSMTGTSDEQLTENSGSVGLKTYAASSGSENSGFCNDNVESRGHDVAVEKIEDTTATGQTDMEEAGDPFSPLPPPSPATLSIIRKAGWLEMKTVLVSKNRKVAPKSKRKWKKYWANLKRSTIFLYECEEQSTLPELETMHSDLKLDLENSLAHAVHDHVKRDHLFCLSTSSGNTYYMQTTSQAEVEDWITCMHCAAAIASTQRDKDHSLPVLMAKVEELNRKIEKENQLKNLTSLNLSAALESTTKSMASDKLVECSENLESFKVELYRIRCYIASLQGTELPNPQSLLGSISKPTKSTLGRIGIFSVASLHAVVSARQSMHTSTSTTSLHLPRTNKLKEKLSSAPRSPAHNRPRRGSLDISGPYPSVSTLAWGKSAKSKASSLPPGLRGSVSLRSFEITGPLPRTPDKKMRGRKFSLDMDGAMHNSPTASKRSMEISRPYLIPPKTLASLRDKQYTPLHSEEERTGDETEEYVDGGCNGVPLSMPLLNVVSVRVPGGKHSGGQVIQLTLRNDTTTRQLLGTVCEKFRLNLADHFLRLKLANEQEIKYFIPEDDDIIIQQENAEIQICQKSLKTVTLRADSAENTDMFGLTLVPEWDANTEIDLQSVLVEGVREGGVAEGEGLRSGDELALISDKSVMELGWVEVERLMSGPEVTVTVRTCVTDGPLSHSFSDRIVEGLICPAPPTSHLGISGEMLSNLIIPTPSVGDSSLQDDGSDLTELTQDQIEHLLTDTHEISKLLRKWESQQTEEASIPWTREDKLRKRVSDLIETEADYVRLLNALVERYFEPLRHETHLSQHEVKNLIGNIVELVQAQNSLLDDLKKAWNSESDSGNPDSDTLTHVVLQVAAVFLRHVEHFKQYSSFCASHQIVKQLLAAEENRALIEFFRVRNPTTNPSLNVDSLLAKPIVRVSRYPLFLNAILENTTKDSEESLKLKEIIKEMGVVADHMNEMQRLCETYWPLLHTLSNDPKLIEVGVAVQIADLRYHGNDITWLNPSIDGLSKGWKKGQGPKMNIFVFRSSVVLLCLERKHKRKESRGLHEIRIDMEDIRYREILPAVECSISNLPDSDGVTNMWRLQHHKAKMNPGLGLNYFFRSKSAQDKMKVTDTIQHSIHEQQKLYGSPNIARAAATTTSTHSPIRVSPVTLHSSPYQRLWRATSPSPSALCSVSPSSATGYGTGTASDTDHD